MKKWNNKKIIGLEEEEDLSKYTLDALSKSENGKRAATM